MQAHKSVRIIEVWSEKTPSSTRKKAVYSIHCLAMGNATSATTQGIDCSSSTIATSAASAAHDNEVPVSIEVELFEEPQQGARSAKWYLQ